MSTGMNTASWIHTAWTLAWRRHAQKNPSEMIVSLIFLGLMTMIQIAIIMLFVVALTVGDNILRAQREQVTRNQMQKAHHPMADTWGYQYKNDSNMNVEWIYQLLLHNAKGTSEEGQSIPLDDDNSENGGADPLLSSVQYFKNAIPDDPQERLKVYTNDPSAWPVALKTDLESALGPLLFISEEQYLAQHQHDVRSMFVGTRMVDGQQHWWYWQHEQVMDFVKDRELFLPQVQAVRSIIIAHGAAARQQYLQTIQQQEDYKALTSWDTPVKLSIPIDIDQRAMALITCSIAFLLTLGVPATAVGFSWDQNRSKGILEPYATTLAPPWVHVLSSSFYYTLPLLATPIIVGLVVWGLMGFDAGLGIKLMVSLLCAVLMAWASMQVNMFLAIHFVTPLGRMVGRILLLPMVVAPFALYRLFWFGDFSQAVQGQSVEQISMTGYGAAAVAGALVGMELLAGSAYGMGKYRKGFLNIK